MDEIAAEARVGKGTLYRRFGDRAGLALSLLDRKEAEVQGLILTGPPPLGPGAPPHRRLVAFLDTLVALVDENTDLHVVSEQGDPEARYRSGAYSFFHRHAEFLIEEARPDLDAAYLADVLLAPLAGGFFRFARDARGVDPARMRAGLQLTARRLLGGRARGSRS